MKRYFTTLSLIAFILIMTGNIAFSQTQRILGGSQIDLDDNTGNHVRLSNAAGSVGINTLGLIPNTCALLDLSSTTKGFLVPRMTTLQELAVCGGAPPEGLIIYNTTTHTLDVYNGAIWGSAGWSLTGNSGTNSALNYLGTNDAQDLVLKTNSAERARILSSGNVAIGAPTATSHLQVTENGISQPAIDGIHTAVSGTLPGVQGETNSQDANASGVLGIVNSTTPGGFSTALRGINNGAGGLGIGVMGTQAGSGWGVYGTTPSGIGVYGLSTSGFGIYGQSTSGVSVYGIQPSNGTNSAGYFQNTNTANASAALFGTTNGAGPAVAGAQSGTADAGLFSISNPANTAHALNSSTNGSGNAVNAVSTGTGRGGLFSIVNAANTNNALEANTNGTGRAGFLSNTNAANSSNTLEVTTNGTGRAILATRAGGSGVVLGLTEAIRGDNSNGPGLAGTSNTSVGVFGTSATSHGIWGVGTVAAVAGVEGRNDNALGFGVEGVSLGGGTGVHGISQTGIAGSFQITNAASSATALDVSSAGTGTGLNITTGNSNNLLVVNGTTDATILNVAADPVWDSRINGDQLVTGVQKIGGSIWLDGTSATHSIVTDAPTNIGTMNDNTLSLITNNLPRLVIDAAGNVSINGNLSVSGTLGGSTVPEVVNFLGGYNSATAYNANDLVTSSTPGVYFFSLSSGNTNNTPESSPTFWGSATIEQLKVIHKTLTLSAPGFTSLMSTHLVGLNTGSGRIQYMVRADDGGSQIATEEGVIQYLATANSITCTVQTTDKLHLGTVNSGCTPGFFNPSSQPGVSVFDNVTFSSPAPIVVHDVYFRIIPAQGVNTAGAITPTSYRLEP